MLDFNISENLENYNECEINSPKLPLAFVFQDKPCCQSRSTVSATPRRVNTISFAGKFPKRSKQRPSDKVMGDHASWSTISPCPCRSAPIVWTKCWPLGHLFRNWVCHEKSYLCYQMLVQYNHHIYFWKYTYMILYINLNLFVEHKNMSDFRKRSNTYNLHEVITYSL